SLINVAQSALLTGKEAERHGNAHPQIVPYRTFTASDGDFVLGVGTDRQFERLAPLVGRPEGSADRRFATNDGLVLNPADLEGELAPIFLRETRETWVARCRGAGIPAGPVRGPLEALRSENARALESVAECRGVSFVAPPVRIEGEPPPLRFPPALDEDGERIRKEFALPESGGGVATAGPLVSVRQAMADRTMTAPRMENGLGRSPMKRKTQTGLEIGSSIPTSAASVAVTCLRPRTK